MAIDSEAPGWQLAFQNPVEDQLRVFLTDDLAGSLQWTILTSWGTEAGTGEWESNSGQNLFNVSVQDLAQGTYFLRVLDRGNSRTVAKPFHIRR